MKTIAFVLFLAAAAQAQDFKKYVWEKLEAGAPAAGDDPLRGELEAEVRKIVDSKEPGAAEFVVGIGGAYHCFANSGELLFAIAEALPFLPAPLQENAKAFMKSVLERHAPWSPAFLLSTAEGWAPKPPSAREPRRVDVPVVNAYFAWKYGDATGDWAAIEKGYGDLRSHFTTRVKDPPQDYPQIVGTIGFARLARHFGKTEDAAAAEAKALQGLKSGVDYEKFFDASLARHLGDHDWTYPPFTERRKEHTLITAYAPELFRLLQDHAGEAVKRHAGAVTDAWARTWFLTRPSLPTFYGPYFAKDGPEKAPNFMKKAWTGAQHDFGQENAYWTPDIACTLFLLRAYALSESAPMLRRWLDVPWTRTGDLYHLQKLVATLRASAHPKWVEIR